MKLRELHWQCLQWSILISLVSSVAFAIVVNVYGGMLSIGLDSFVRTWYNFDAKKISQKDLNFEISKNPVYTGKNPLLFHAILVCTAAVILVVYSVTGIYSIWRFSIYLVKTTILLISISVMFDLFIFAQFIDEDSLINIWAKDSMTTSMFADFDVNSKQMSYWNSIMVMGECCGISGPGDFQFRTGMNETEDDISMPRMWPPACCTNTLLRMSHIRKDCYDVAMPNDVMSKINIGGCYSKLMDVFALDYLYIVIFIAFSVFQVVQVILCICLIYFSKFQALEEQVFEEGEEDEFQTSNRNSMEMKKIGQSASLKTSSKHEVTGLHDSSYGVLTDKTSGLQLKPSGDRIAGASYSGPPRTASTLDNSARVKNPSLSPH